MSHGAGKLMWFVLIATIIFIFLWYLQERRQEGFLSKPRRESQIKLEQLHHNFPSDNDHIKVSSVFQIPGEEIYLHTAYLDSRFGQRILRVFGMLKRGENIKVYCSFNKSKTRTVVLPALTHYIYPNWPMVTYYHAVGYYCTLPPSFETPATPTSVWMSTSRGRGAVGVRVFKSWTSTSNDLAICVKAWSGRLDPVPLVEWLEIYRALGINKVLFYEHDVRGPAEDVLKYYQYMGFVDIIPFPFHRELTEKVRLKYNPRYRGAAMFGLSQQLYLISLNECLYKYSHRYKYILQVDLDELVLPTKNELLLESILRAVRRHPSMAGFSFWTGWHFSDFGPKPDIPKYLQMLRYPRRTDVINVQPKSVIRTDRFITINWHGVITAHTPDGDDPFINYNLPWQEYGYVHHYRGKCTLKFPLSLCHNLTRTFSESVVMIDYANRMHLKIRAVLKNLGLFAKT